MSYPSRDLALANSVRLMQEGGAQMVKLESGAGQAQIVEFLGSVTTSPVCAHLGLKPQSVHKTGGFRVQGREMSEAAARCCEDAKALEAAGADHDTARVHSVARLAASITKELSGARHRYRAGPSTDGQILVLYDILDITSGPQATLRAQFHGRGAGTNLRGR